MLSPRATRPEGARRPRPLVALDAHTVGRRKTGSERYVLELARALGKRGEVDLLAYVDRGVKWPVDYSPAPQIRELRSRAPQLRIPLELPYRARRDRVDLLHVTFIGPPVAGPPLVTTIHDLSFEDRPDFFPLPTRLRLQSLVRLSARRSAAVIAISRFTRERLIDVYGLPAERVHYVPPGVGAQWHAPGDAAAEAALDSYRLPACFILCVGSANRRKNLARVIEAVARLRQAGLPTLELLICGPPGGADRAVRRATDAAGGAEWVRWLGYVSDDVLRALYARAAAVVYVSLYEGFGLPVLEALACGGVVVASSTTAVSEAAGDACIRVDPEDVEQVADGIRAAVEDESLRGALRGRAAAHLAGFDWDATAAATVDVYRAALDRR